MVTFNVDSLDFQDDEEVRYGASTDFATRFSSGNNRFELADLTNNTTGYVQKGQGADLHAGKFGQVLDDGQVLADDNNIYETIQNAVNASSNWVKIGPGYFGETVSISDDGLTLVGSGYNTLIDGGNGTAIDTSGSNSSIYSLRVTNSSDGTDGGGKNGIRISSPDVHIDSCYIDGSDDIGVATSGANTTVTNCTVTNTDGEGIYSFGSVETIVSNCRVTSAGNTSIRVNSNSCVVAGNMCLDNTTGIGGSGSDSLYVGNRINNSSDKGVDISGDDCIVAKNRISNSINSNIDNSGSGNILDNNLTT